MVGEVDPLARVGLAVDPAHAGPAEDAGNDGQERGGHLATGLFPGKLQTRRCCFKRKWHIILRDGVGIGPTHTGPMLRWLPAGTLAGTISADFSSQGTLLADSGPSAAAPAAARRACLPAALRA